MDAQWVSGHMTRGLLIDDDVVYLSALRRAFTRRGFEILTAADATGAIAHARCGAPDFVLLDLKLGTTSGLDLIAPLRALLPSAQIVLLTGYASIATAVEAIKRGADHYLAKPANIASILRALAGEPMCEAPVSLPMTPLSRLEWEHIQQAMVDTEGNVSAAARLLGMYRRTLQRKLAKRPDLGRLRTVVKDAKE
jgi:two-component system response regulator RegA